MLKTWRARTALVACGIVASSVGFVALSGSTATEAVGASSPIYGTCTGTRQGVIKGDSTVTTQKGMWTIAHISDGLVTPYDQATGQPTGRHQEQGIKITMAASTATIGLVNAQIDNELLTSCTFTFYRPLSNGQQQAYFQIKLGNAVVTSYALSGSPTGGTSTDFTLIPQHILRTWLIGGLTSSDSWANLT